MIKNVIAIGVFPFLLACNSSNSNNDPSGISPGSPGFDIEKPTDGDESTGGGTPIQPGDPSHEGEINPGHNSTYKKIADHLGLQYDHIAKICDTDYRSDIPLTYRYELNCFWNEDLNNFSIHYFETQKEAIHGSAEATVVFDINETNIQHGIIGLNAQISHPLPHNFVSVSDFKMQISEHPNNWENSAEYTYEFHTLSNASELVINNKNQDKLDGIDIYNLFNSTDKNFRFSSNIMLSSGSVEIYNDIYNSVLFANLYETLR